MPRAKTATVGLKTRMKEPLRAQIEGAAKKRGVSLNAEIVNRLEQSFRREKREGLIEAMVAKGIYSSFGGVQTFTVLRLLANAINIIQSRTGESWEDDPDTFDSVQEACYGILHVFRPKAGGDANFPELYAQIFTDTESDHLGIDVAKEVAQNFLASAKITEHLKAAQRSSSKTEKESDAKA